MSGGRLYLDGASGNTLGGALDLEVGDDVCDLLERHVDVSCEDDTVLFLMSPRISKKRNRKLPFLIFFSAVSRHCAAQWFQRVW